jgi:hypothetical protein
MVRATDDPDAVMREEMARARRPLAVWLLAAAILLGDAVPTLGHYPVNVEHTATAYCLVTQAGSWLQSYVVNMNPIPAPGSFSFGGGGAFFTPTGYSTTYSSEYLYYQVRATLKWQATGYTPLYGTLLRSLGQMGLSRPWVTEYWTGSGWKPTSVQVIYNGRADGKSDLSIVQLPGPGWYWIDARFYWGPITNSAGQVVVNPIDHWQAIGWVQCA